MELFKIGLLGILVLVAVHSCVACQCDRADLSLHGTYCHRLVDQNQNTALVQAEICHKELDDGFAEHFMLIKDVYLEPLMIGYGRSIQPRYATATPTCATVPRTQQTMLLTSRENRAAACGIPSELIIGRTYVMEIMYTGAQWDITSCGYHKGIRYVTPVEHQTLGLFKARNYRGICPTEAPAPNRRQ